MAILLSDEEIYTLEGQDYFIYVLYVHGIRRYMDYSTGIVGIKRRISYQSLREELFVEKRSGVQLEKSGSPSRSKVRRGIVQLEKIGLLVKIKNKDNIIFRCPLARQDKSVQNKAGTRPTHHPDTEADTLEHKKNPYETRTYEEIKSQADTQAAIPLIAQADTPPLSVKEKELLLRNSSKKKGSRLPDSFQVNSHHVELANQNSWPDPHTEIDAFKDYHLARGTTFLDWDRAFYTWLRNAKKFQGGKTNGNIEQTRKQNSFDRAIANIINSAQGSR